MSEHVPLSATPREEGTDDEPQALSAEQIDATLRDFRTWLTELVELPPPDDEPDPIDLNTIVGQFTALRHEVNLQTKASRTSIEQNGESLRQLTEALAAVKDRPTGDDPQLKPMIKAIVDVADNLSIALRQVEKQRSTMDGTLQELSSNLDVAPVPELPKATVPDVVKQPVGFWSRLFGRTTPPVPSELTEAIGRQLLIDWREQVLADQRARREKSSELANRVRSSIDGMITGYRMSLSRVDRVLEQFGLQTIPTEGERFDPELMEVVEVVTGTDRPAGEVVEQVRRGLRWKGAIFRFAQVKVAK